MRNICGDLCSCFENCSSVTRTAGACTRARAAPATNTGCRCPSRLRVPCGLPSGAPRGRAAPGLYWQPPSAVPFGGWDTRPAAMSTTSSPLISAEALAERLGDPTSACSTAGSISRKPDAGERDVRAGAHAGRRPRPPRPRPFRRRHAATRAAILCPPPPTSRRRLRRPGASGDIAGRAYDAGNGVYAARLWWMLRWLGHERVAGAGWRLRALAVARSAGDDGNAVISARRDFVARPRSRYRRRRGDGARGRSRDAGCRVLDARGAGALPRRERAARSRGRPRTRRRQSPAPTNLGADGRFRAPDAASPQLRARRSAARRRARRRHVRLRRHRLSQLLAMEHAGLAGARLYPGSWSEWIRDPHRPIARG